MWDSALQHQLVQWKSHLHWRRQYGNGGDGVAFSAMLVMLVLGSQLFARCR
jgi:hypothetical protein